MRPAAFWLSLLRVCSIAEGLCVASARPSNTVFYFRHTLTQGNADSQFTWPAGTADWIPVAGTYTS